MSRVDSVRIAVEKAREFGHDLAGIVARVRRLLPVPDGPQLALEAGTPRSSSRAGRGATTR